MLYTWMIFGLTSISYLLYRLHVDIQCLYGMIGTLLAKGWDEGLEDEGALRRNPAEWKEKENFRYNVGFLAQRQITLIKMFSYFLGALFLIILLLPYMHAPELVVFLVAMTGMPLCQFLKRELNRDLLDLIRTRKEAKRAAKGCKESFEYDVWYIAGRQLKSYYFMRLFLDGGMLCLLAIAVIALLQVVF